MCARVGSCCSYILTYYQKQIPRRIASCSAHACCELHEVCLGCLQRALFLHANDVKPALEWLSERFGRLQSGVGSSDLTSTLSLSSHPVATDGRSAPKGFQFGRDPSTPGSRESALLWCFENCLFQSLSMGIMQRPDQRCTAEGLGDLCP